MTYELANGAALIRWRRKDGFQRDETRLESPGWQDAKEDGLHISPDRSTERHVEVDRPIWFSCGYFFGSDRRENTDLNSGEPVF